MLKRASAVSHPGSEPQKKVALDTEQQPTPRPSVSHGGSSASRTRHTTTMRTDQSTHTSVATRETRGEQPAQGVTQASNGNNTGGDVVMEGNSVGESSFEHPNLSGSDGRRRITTKREPREVRNEEPTVIEQHVPRRILGKTTPQEHAVAVTTQEAPNWYREKTMRIENVKNQSLNWVSISSAGALDMTHL